MHHHADFKRFLSFFGFGFLCLIACCMGLFGFMAQNAYHSLAHAHQSVDAPSLQMASKFKGIDFNDSKFEFKPLGFDYEIDQKL